ncbi:MAG TPA: ferritin-like domain-containing protein [Puia sp.]|nr:ferritin-like domain-containing protein [Puia sp.]
MKEQKLHDYLQETLHRPIQRKRFLRFTALASGSFMLGLTACRKEGHPGSGVIDVGSADIGILNFAYALEQIEAAFYTKVAASWYKNAPLSEMQVLFDIMHHEVAHRDFLKKALGSNAIGDLQFDFTTVDFTSRDSVLKTAKALEDTGVSAYNGAGPFLQSADYLKIAGKIVSVEARHAAAIRDILNPKSADFAGDDTVDPATGLDLARTPNSTTYGQSIVATANSFLLTKISATQLP